MTNAEIKQKIVDHFKMQGAYAIEGDQCRYLAPDGTKCAIGCLIDDDKYDPRIEGAGITHHYGDGAREALIASGIELNEDRLDFLYDLQRLHDTHATSGAPFPQFLENLRFLQTPGGTL